MNEGPCRAALVAYSSIDCARIIFYLFCDTFRFLVKRCNNKYYRLLVGYAFV